LLSGEIRRAYLVSTESIPSALLFRHELFVIVLKRLTHRECGKLTRVAQAGLRG
jgi:hypothetical protein